MAHQLVFAQRYRVDLIPFGGLERADRSIAWPPHQDVEMQVLGFREALAHAVEVRLPHDMTVAVASLPAQAALKLFAWRDRRLDRPGLDAGDLRRLLRHYLDAGNEDRLYTEASHFLTMDKFDRGCVSAWLLGCDARRLLLEPDGTDATALESLLMLLANEIDPDGRLALVTDMRSGDAQTDLDLLTFFGAGLDGRHAP